MLTLSLLRHGKSAWDDPKLDDHERPLARRGRVAAEEMGAYIAAHGLRPDLVLCSSAVRTRQTLNQMLIQLGPPAPKTVIERALYLATPTTMLACVRRTASEAQHLMLIGHNPGMHALALDLAGSGLRRDIASMAIKYPTCALAVLTFEAEDWAEIRPAAGRLLLFMPPRSLA